MRHVRYVSVAAATTLALAGCGSATQMPRMSGMSASPAATRDAPTATNAIDISSFAFAPANATVPVGTAVTWTNHDQDPHTVVTQPGAPGGGFRSGTLKAGDTFTFTFQAPGRYQYLCSIHPFMTATVTVTA